MKKLICILLCMSVFSFGAYADAPDNGRAAGDSANSGIVTDYYSDDIDAPFEDEIQVAALSGDELGLNAKAAILVDLATGTVLYEQNADEQRAPASITKVMTMLLVTEAIESGKFTVDDTVTCSEYASKMGGSQIWLEPGETMTVDELLRATVIGSANDAACALGEFVAGSDEAFVAMMNRRAEELGMTNTHFVNCNGLDADGHMTSARDIAIMSRELISHEFIKKYTTVWMDTLRNGATELVNTNKLIRFYDGATGLKTGTTDKAGHCLAATASRGDLELVAVVLGCSSGAERFTDARKLLDFGFANWTTVTVDVADDELPQLSVTKGVKRDLNISAASTASFLIEKGREADVKKSVSTVESVTAPVREGDTVGRVTVTLDDVTLGEIDIVAAESVGKMTFSKALGRLAKALFKL